MGEDDRCLGAGRSLSWARSSGVLGEVERGLGRGRAGSWERSSGVLGEVERGLGRGRAGSWERSSGVMGEVERGLGRGRAGSWERSSGVMGEVERGLGAGVHRSTCRIYVLLCGIGCGGPSGETSVVKLAGGAQCNGGIGDWGGLWSGVPPGSGVWASQHAAYPPGSPGRCWPRSLVPGGFWVWASFGGWGSMLRAAGGGVYRQAWTRAAAISWA